jgi:superfamily II DNA or RNA helicase
MVDKVSLTKINETYVKIHCELDILQEIYEEYQFYVPGYKHTPKYKAGVWDGKIKLIDLYRQKTYVGLQNSIAKFCSSRGYEFSGCFENHIITPQDVVNFITSLNIPFKIRDYQYYAVYKALKDKRALILSPTGSGKSAQIYSIVRYLQPDHKILLVVPTVSLVMQMKNDFIDYAGSSTAQDDFHLIFSGKEKQTDKPITISTWQSIYNMPDEWFKKYDVVIVDEVHQAKAASLTKIVEKAVNAKYKIGFTGSLDKSATHQMMLTALFNDPIRVATTRELIEKGYLCDIEIKCVVLKYNDEINKAFKKIEYQKEIDFIVQNEDRLKFVVNLANTLQGNTLILFNFVEKHGEKLYNELKKNSDKKVFFIHGGVDAEERETIRNIFEEHNNVITVASVGTTSTGTNIRKLHNLILAQPTKSVIRVLQSIGRGLRKHNEKSKLNVFDIADLLSNTAKKNHTYNHFIDRLKIYNDEEFNYSINEVSIGK